MEMIAKGIEILHRADGAQRFKAFVEIEKKNLFGIKRIKRHHISRLGSVDNYFVISYNSDIFEPAVFNTEVEATTALDETLDRYKKEGKAQRDAVIVKTEDKYI